MQKGNFSDDFLFAGNEMTRTHRISILHPKFVTVKELVSGYFCIHKKCRKRLYYRCIKISNNQNT